MLQRAKHAVAWFVRKASETYAWNPDLINRR